MKLPEDAPDAPKDEGPQTRAPEGRPGGEPVRRGAEGARPGEAPPSARQGESKPEVKREFVGTGLFWGLVVGLLFAVAFLIFILQNTESVSVDWLGWTFRAPLVGVLLATAIIAVLVDQVAGLAWRRARRRRLSTREELRALKKKNGERR